MNTVENKAFTAIQKRKDEVLTRLLDEGLDVNLQDPDGDTLLLYAAKQGTVTPKKKRLILLKSGQATQNSALIYRIEKKNL